MITENQGLFVKFKKSINCFIEYLSPLDCSTDREEIKALFDRFQGARNELKGSVDKLSLDMINNLLAVGCEEYSKLIDIDPGYKIAHLE